MIQKYFPLEVWILIIQKSIVILPSSLVTLFVKIMNGFSFSGRSEHFIGVKNIKRECKQFMFGTWLHLYNTLDGITINIHFCLG